MNAHSDATFVVFTMHGMGVNDTDVPTMVLLPELAYRYSTGKTLFHPKPGWLEATTPSLSPGEDWTTVIRACYRHTARDIMYRKLRKRIQRTRSAIERRIHPQEMVGHSNALVEARYSVGWMPAMQYQPYWHKMDVIGIPAFFDGLLRVNLEGREAAGTVSIEKFTQVIDEFEAVLRNCKDMITGEPVVKELSRPGGDDPFSLSSTQADIHILWNGSPMGFKHPELGIIGPAPWRRMGGHSGTLGALHILGTSLEPGFFGVRSSFDVAATVADLVGLDVSSVDGESVLDHSRSSPRA